jgi:hypothetical protein
MWAAQRRRTVGARFPPKEGDMPRSTPRRTRHRRRAVRLAALAGLAGLTIAGPPAVMGHPQHFRPMSKFDMPNAPDLERATPEERAAARALLRRSRRAAARLASPAAARRAGYVPSGHWSRQGMMHFNDRALEHDRHVLDPRHPEAVVFMRMPGGGTMLAALMFRAASDRPAPSPAPTIVRWHAHIACAPPRPRHPLQFASPHCPKGTVAHYGSTQMTHVWFARALGEAFSMHPSMDAISGP